MPAKRVTRASTRAARATAADPPTVPANPPVPAPVPAPTNVAQETPAGGPSPRRTRSGKILGMVKSVATKLTRARRAPKAAPIQEAAREVEDNIEVVPTTDLATVPQPPAPPRKRGGKAAKKDETEVQIAADDAAVSSSTTEPAPAPAPVPTKRTVKRTKSTRSQASNGKGKAPELPVEDDHALQPTVDSAPVPTAPISPKSQKPVEDIERVTRNLRILNATVLANDQIQLIENTWESCIFDNTKLKCLNAPKDAVRLVRQAYAPPPPPTRGHATVPTQITARNGARDQGRAGGQPQQPVASTSRAVAPSNTEPKPAPLKREGAINWGHPEYYKERIRKAQEAGGSLAPADLDHPANDQPPLPSSSSIVPSASASTSRPITANGTAPSGNGNGNASAAASDTPPPPARIQRWNAVILGYPEGYTPRDPWPASMIDPTGLSTHPDVVRDASGALILPASLSASVALATTRVAPPPIPTPAPQVPARAPQPPVAASQPAPVTSHSPPTSPSSNESADLAEVEASVTFDLEDGDAHPAADLLAPTAQPTAQATAQPTSSSNPPPTSAYASFFDTRGREIPPHHNDDDAVVQQVIAHVLREVEAERAARPAQSAPRLQITRTEAPPAPKPAAPTSRPAAARPAARPGVSTGMSIFGPNGFEGIMAKVKAKANATSSSTAHASDKDKGKGKGKETAVPQRTGPPPTRIFGPAPADKGKKRAREPEPVRASEPGVQLWGYASSAGPMKAKVSLVPVVPSPKRQRVSEAGGEMNTEGPVGPAAVDVQGECASAEGEEEEEEEDQVLPASTQNAAAKRSRTEFEEGASHTDTAREHEGETRPTKKLRTRSQ